MKIKNLSHTARPVLVGSVHHVVYKSNIKFSLQSPIVTAKIKSLLQYIQINYNVTIAQYYINYNHIHLLVIPHSFNHFSLALGQFASRLALFLNARLARKGPYWSQRFFSAIKKSAGALKRAISYVARQVKNVDPLKNIYSSLFDYGEYPYGIPPSVLKKIGIGNSKEMLIEVIQTGTVKYRGRGGRDGSHPVLTLMQIALFPHG